MRNLIIAIVLFLPASSALAWDRHYRPHFHPTYYAPTYHYSYCPQPFYASPYYYPPHPVDVQPRHWHAGPYVMDYRDFYGFR